MRTLHHKELFPAKTGEPEIYQRLYYIPIVVAAYRYGLGGAVAASMTSAIVYAPHIFMHWENRQIYWLNQNAEIVMFQVIAVVTGLLARAEKRERLRYQRTAEELHQAYDELKRAYSQLVRADRLAALGEVSAGIVHEIRTPLASIPWITGLQPQISRIITEEE